MKILILSSGCAESIKTWSGVPYHVVRELRSLGHECVCIDDSKILVHKYFRIFYNRILRKIMPNFFAAPFACTKLSILWQSFWVKRLLKKNPQLNLVIAFSYSYKFSNLSIPSVLIHDWTNGYHFKKLTVSEKRALKAQVDALKSATLVVTLYPKVYEYLKDRFCIKNARFYCNPINAKEYDGDVEALIRSRYDSKHILCCGGEFYRPNVETVLKAVSLLEDKSIIVDVIGLTSVNNLYGANVNCYGFLNKGIPNQAKIYNQLIEKAKFLINVREQWGGGSSIAEMMHGYLPVIVGDYPDIVKLYGENAQFGFYSKQGDTVVLAETLKKAFSLSYKEYIKKCKAGYEITKDHTYRNFVANLLTDLKSLKKD